MGPAGVGAGESFGEQVLDLRNGERDHAGVGGGRWSMVTGGCEAWNVVSSEAPF